MKKKLFPLIIFTFAISISSLNYYAIPEKANAADQPSQVSENNSFSSGNSMSDQTVTNPPENTGITTSSESKIFNLDFSDTEFLNYSPIKITRKVKDITNFNLPIPDQLTYLYSPYVEFKNTNTIDNSWGALDSNTRLIFGDIVVTDDFSSVGICIGKNEIISLNDGKTNGVEKFKYYNKDFHIKTIKEVW